MPEIEVGCPAIFGFDLQPGTFAAHAPALVQGMTQQRAAPSARLVPRLNIQGRDFQRRAIAQWGRRRRTYLHQTINSDPVLRYPDRQIGIADRVTKLLRREFCKNIVRKYRANAVPEINIHPDLYAHRGQTGRVSFFSLPDHACSHPCTRRAAEIRRLLSAASYDTI